MSLPDRRDDFLATSEAQQTQSSEIKTALMGPIQNMFKSVACGIELKNVTLVYTVA